MRELHQKTKSHCERRRLAPRIPEQFFPRDELSSTSYDCEIIDNELQRRKRFKKARCWDMKLIGLLVMCLANRQATSLQIKTIKVNPFSNKNLISGRIRKYSTSLLDIDEYIAGLSGRRCKKFHIHAETVNHDQVVNDMAGEDELARLKKQIEEQKRQIDLLVRVMKTSSIPQPSPTSEISNPFTSSSTERSYGVEPLKAMLFIDGTWLYYSLFTRNEQFCPIIRRFGRYWYHYYYVDWNALPRSICQQLQRQHATQGWYSLTDGDNTPEQAGGESTSESIGNSQNTTSISRGVEIVRACVYTSYSATTDKGSLRVKMFDEMRANHYDVHIMETLGKSEKCVDIQLAVEMLHYATVGTNQKDSAYDIAILLSGDKDFIPALVRTRQKGKRTSVVSMRTGCNRALVESPHIKDYSVIWMDDFLDQIIRPLRERGDYADDHDHNHRLVSSVTMMKLIHDFIEQAEKKQVSSRDIGRYLKNVEMGDGQGGTTNMLEQLKDVHGGLRFFLSQHNNVFTIIDRAEHEEHAAQQRDPSDRTYLVEIADIEDDFEATDDDDIEVKQSVHDILNEVASKTTFSKEEQEFLKSYDNLDTKNEGTSWDSYYSEDFDAIQSSEHGKEQVTETKDSKKSPTKEDRADYASLKVAELKELCRLKGIPVSGTKNALIERLLSVLEDEVEKEKEIVSAPVLDIPQSSFPPSLPRSSVDSHFEFSVSSEYPHIQPPKLERAASRMNRSRMGGARLGTPLNSQRVGRPLQTVTVSVPLNKQDEEAVANHLDALIAEYVQARGGQAGSRDVGRYLAANPSSKGDSRAALTELKDHFGSLAVYLNQRREKFRKLPEDVARYGKDYGFPILIQA